MEKQKQQQQQQQQTDKTLRIREELLVTNWAINDPTKRKPSCYSYYNRELIYLIVFSAGGRWRNTFLGLA